MKSQILGFSLGKQNVSERSAILSTFMVLLLSSSFFYYYPSSLYFFKLLAGYPQSDTNEPQKVVGSSPPITPTPSCDLSRGEWVPEAEAPYYTNTTCRMIQEHQNCMKFGRPNVEFMKWRWKPDGCELPLFDPEAFLETMRGKSMAFVGDSLARNQMQSLMCLLSRVEYPNDISNTSDDNFKRMFYTSHNFTISSFWSPFLVKSEEGRLHGPDWSGIWYLYLDEPDEKWISSIDRFDFIIISDGNWFTRPSIFFENKTLVGSNYYFKENITSLTMYYSHKKAFQTAFNAINQLRSFKGTTILRTLSPSHFENGEWNTGGDCKRTTPFGKNDTRLAPKEARLYHDQVRSFLKAKKLGKKKGLEFRLLDTTQAMLLRPDGHPSHYGHWPENNVTLYNDCVHWCLPGPIDVWNDMLLHILKF